MLNIPFITPRQRTAVRTARLRVYYDLRYSDEMLLQDMSIVFDGTPAGGMLIDTQPSINVPSRGSVVMSRCHVTAIERLRRAVGSVSGGWPAARPLLAIEISARCVMQLPSWEQLQHRLAASNRPRFTMRLTDDRATEWLHDALFTAFGPQVHSSQMVVCDRVTFRAMFERQPTHDQRGVSESTVDRTTVRG